MNVNNPAQFLVLSVVTAGLLIGCQDTGPTNEKFFVEDDTKSVNLAISRQVANGARHDGMLRDQHFDGTQLNSLGRDKLDRILASAGPVTVYLPGSVDQAAEAGRRESILAYAKDHGRSADAVSVVAGIKPDTLHRASTLGTRLAKTESGALEGGGGGESNASQDLGLSGNNMTPGPGSTPNRTGG